MYKEKSVKKSRTKKLVAMMACVALMLGIGVVAGAEGESLLDPQVSNIISNFADSLKPTVLEMIAIIVPAGLGIWAVGFGIKKGLAVLKGQAKRAL